MNASRATTIQLGNLTVTYTMHHVPGVGPRVSMTLHEPPEPPRIYNLSPSDMRTLGINSTLAAGGAEAITRREQRGKEKAA